MKKLNLSISILFITLFLPSLWNGSGLSAQNIAITDDDTYTADPSAMLDVKSINKGVLLPRLTTVQRNLVSNPATGLLVFDTNENTYYFYNGTAWVNVSSGAQVWNQTGSQVHLADPSNNVGVGTSNPQNKLSVKGDASSGNNEAIFSVVSPSGDTLFAVYPDGTRIYVNDSPAKAIGSKGGFAVGGFSPAKAGTTNEYLRVTPDSVRIYIEENSGAKAIGSKGGFAVGGFSPAKTLINDYLSVNSDSINVSKSLYIPRMTTTERDNLGFTPSEALIIFNTTDKCMQIYENDVWSNIWCFNCAPAIIIQPTSKTICEGNDTTFFVSATGTNLQYQWQVSSNGGTTWNNITNGGTNPTYSGATSWSLSLLNVPAGYNSYQYRCVATASCTPSVTSVATVLSVNALTAITSQPANQQLSDNCNVTFSVSTVGTNNVYKWQESSDGGISWNDLSDGGTNPAYSGSASGSLTLSNVVSNYNNYKFRCIINNTCSPDVISNAAILTVPQYATITSQPANQQLLSDCSVNFNITASGSGNSYQWQQSSDGGSSWNNISNGGSSPAYSGATYYTLNLSNVPLSFNNYKYRCNLASTCRLDVLASNAATLSISFNAPVAVNATNIAKTSFTADWNSVPGATNYYIDVSTVSNFSSFVSGYENLSLPLFSDYNVTGLSQNTVYYYRVRAKVCNYLTSNSNTITQTTAQYAVGDNYGGGIVFYVNSQGQGGYVAPTSDQSSGAQWGCNGTGIEGADDTGLGTGCLNTGDYQVDCNEAGMAPYICDNLVLNGYSDWCLPSKDELNQIYINKSIIGGFSTNYYWSSSEYNDYNNAWSINFNNGTSVYDYKTSSFNVRCFRDF